MPVIIRDVNWEETDANLVLHIPMKGAKANKLDVLSSDQYLKVYLNFFCSIFNSVFDVL
jgi:HSP20 family molecular chaperone IbpA